MRRRLWLALAAASLVPSAARQIAGKDLDFYVVDQDNTELTDVVIKDSYTKAILRGGVKVHHADGIQLYPFRRAYAGAILSNCKIARCSISSEYSLQGITAFDGGFHDLAIENNVIQVKSEHSITICGMLSGSVIGNECSTLIRLLPLRLAGGYSVWITSFSPDSSIQYGELELQAEAQDLRAEPYSSGINLANFEYDLFYTHILRENIVKPETIQEVALKYGHIITTRFSRLSS